MADKRLGQILFEDVQIIFRNFEGKESEYNTRGNKNFGVLIPDHAKAIDMAEDGWNIKFLKARDEDEEDEDELRPWLPVAISWKNKPPRCVMITSRGRTNLNEDTVELLDWADIQKVDLIVNPYQWVVNGASGVKAYVKTIFVTIEEDELEMKYADLHDADALPVDDTPGEEVIG